MIEEVILVNEKDEVIGAMEKMEAHRKGLLHRAFSIIIYNSKGQVLLQRRAGHKYHSQGLWSNTCCSHPRPGEDVLNAAFRRLREEMGMTTDLKVTGSFIYKAVFPGGITEHELDYVIKGVSDETPVLNKDEAADFKYMDVDEVAADMKKHPALYTAWFHEIVRHFLL